MIKTAKSKLGLKKLKKNEPISNEEYVYDPTDLDLAREVINAEKYVQGFLDEGGKYLCARLRPGFIGDVVYIPGGASYIQQERGKPYGTVVAIPNKNGTVTMGISYISSEDENRAFPIMGLALALKNAVEERDKGVEGITERLVRNKSKKQVAYFQKRALAYFNPDVYSWSRGKPETKVVYDDYEAIHKRREMILNASK